MVFSLRPVAIVLCIGLVTLSLSTSASLKPVLPKTPLGLQAILNSGIPADQPLLSITTLDRIPTAEDVIALEAEGLQVQPLRHLPMALTKGTWPQMLRAFQNGKARDLYLDHALQFASEESTAAIGADRTRALGYTGEGIGIAIVDSGIDASHPVLRSRVVRNVVVYSPEYLEITGLSQLGLASPSGPALVIPLDALPYSNTDTSGHGTLVAGIAAGDGDADPALVGVAPRANLIGYSTGQGVFVISVLASFDDILEHKDEYNIRVVNNSWGNAYQSFDPDSPINIATRALHDAGITVVFAAGNVLLANDNAQVEMSVGPYSQAPWVINVCSGTIGREKSVTSSSGLMYDNSQGAALDEDRHVHYEGDGRGITGPDVCAPGVEITGPGTSTGVVVSTGTLPGGSNTKSGTSLAAPHVAGLAAVLLSARPDLTPDQIRQVIEVTAVPMADDTQFWETGYGWVDARAAVDLVTSPEFSQEALDRKSAERLKKALAKRAYKVLASDHWIFTELLGSAGDLVSEDFPITVKPKTRAIRASIAFPGDAGAATLNVLFNWRLDLIDPAGTVVASSSLLPMSPGTGVLQYTAAENAESLTAGNWTLRASGQLHLTQPRLLWGHLISVAATQLAKNDAATTSESPSNVMNSLPVAVSRPTGRFGGAFNGGALMLLIAAGVMRRRFHHRP